MGKSLHKVFKNVVKNISQSGSEITHFISEPGKFADAIKFSDDIKKPWLKATQNYIKKLINNQTFMVEYPKKGKPEASCMDVYREKFNLMEFLIN